MCRLASVVYQLVTCITCFKLDSYERSQIAKCSIPLQIREQLPELKAVVQYKGKLSKNSPNVYDVSMARQDFIGTSISFVTLCYVKNTFRQ